MILLITRYNLSPKWVQLILFLIFYFICLNLHYIDYTLLECMPNITYFQVHSVEPHLEYFTEKYKPEIAIETNTAERSLAPLFEFLKTEDSQYVGDTSTFDTRSLPEKVNTLQRAYFTESIENSVLKDAINKQEEQLVSRHQDLINAKFTIKHLEKDIETLRKQVEDLLAERK